ncbi:hypothetical protein EON82_19995, partial [bacterium]
PMATTSAGDARVEKWVSASQGYGQTRLNRNAVGQPLVLNGMPVAHGIGTHASSTIAIDLPDGSTRFRARVGLESEGARLNGGGTLKILVFTQDPMVGSALPTAPVPFDLTALGLGPKVQVRDLWSHRSLGTHENVFAPELSWHGAGLYRISPLRQR